MFFLPSKINGVLPADKMVDYYCKLYIYTILIPLCNIFIEMWFMNDGWLMVD